MSQSTALLERQSETEILCNSLIIEGLFLDSFYAFLLASPLGPRN